MAPSHGALLPAGIWVDVEENLNVIFALTIKVPAPKDLLWMTVGVAAAGMLTGPLAAETSIMGVNAEVGNTISAIVLPPLCDNSSGDSPCSAGTCVSQPHTF